jgi:hypothetical protein
MVTHFYDSSSDSVETQDVRLKPARTISDAHIPCLVWAEDALSFAHSVPTCLFALQLLVPDEHIHEACSAVATMLAYIKIEEPNQAWLEHRFINPSQPTCFPKSVHLRLTKRQHEDDPEAIYIHPQSFFSMDVRNHNLSMNLVPPLPSTNSQIRFPTRTAFLDSLIDTLLDPPIGFRHWKLTQSMEVYIVYLITYTLRAYPSVLPSGELEPEHESVLSSLKVENRHYFEGRIRRTSLGWFADVQERRSILERAR